MNRIVLNESQFHDLILKINQEMDKVNTHPTEKQCKAGNYSMGHIRIGGFNITIENPKGSYRYFKNDDGSQGKIQMKNHYGYFTKTDGKDGDAIDVFVGTHFDFDKVFVVDQNNKKGEFDESKVMLGFRSIEEAKQAYLNNFSPDWKGFRTITSVDIPFFKKWLYDGLRQRKPFSEYCDVEKKKIEKLNEIKLNLDKYYTPDTEAQNCIDIFQRCAEANKWNVTSYLEPSAGSGAFSSKLPNCTAIDIKPEADGIQQGDFLNMDIPYEKGRCVIGNPPYGNKMLLAQRFLRKASEIGDYIAFVLPSSQLDNNQTLRNFKLVKSVPLGDVLYSNSRNVKTCFNIYARIENKEKRQINNLQDVTIIRSDNPRYDEMPFDLRIIGWGDAGKIINNSPKKYAAEYKIIVNNPMIKDKVINAISNANWKEITHSYLRAVKIQKFHIIDLLKQEIPEIK